jgi:glutaredoxin-like YruB-family protein
MRKYIGGLLAALLIAGATMVYATDLPQSPVSPKASSKQTKYPKIVLYSTSWCPHCKEAKEYFTRNNIPFINRDVEIDPDAMTVLTGKYKSQGVPVIVLGDDAVVLKGFSEARFEKAVEKAKKK